MRRISTLLVVTASCTVAMTSGAWAQTRETVTIRGQPQSLHVYGTRGGTPVIVSSGDGGWVHLGPYVAEVLSANGFFVVGFDVKAYLERFTSGKATLRPEDEPSDYKVLADFAARGTTRKPILIGVSEGAGLSVLAATDPRMKTEVGGVICLGLPELNELGWRFKDAMIYLTHRVPDEPTFRVSTIVDRVAPVPARARFTRRTTSSCRSRRSSACWTAPRIQRSSGSSRRPITGSVTTLPSSTSACSKPSRGRRGTRRDEACTWSGGYLRSSPVDETQSTASASAAANLDAPPLNR
jgi:hypothetical protein